MALPINEATPNWNDHHACWNFEFRGSLGESLLHVLIVCDTKRHTKLAKMLVKCFPELALDIVEGDEFRGAAPSPFLPWASLIKMKKYIYIVLFSNSCSSIWAPGASGLHLAIAYNNMEMVKELIENGASITQRATGE